ncbi:hypothetical protein CIPAW_04G197100 [Carya illinoinensis]|uniref:Transcription factor CBF/NF-Y/archaeal histone domain-containing protein n=1 Tax=Carya illinoinensis TaxID=32201 RepID=A0A8T1QYD2_CARIL|nr:hypothetical protein CIPAW_04G197100 [Carya illinoinensis]
MADSDNESSGGHNNSNNANSDFSSREQDRFLPIANVSRIMKKALPANAKISKDAKETVQECVSEFISFITGEASDKCQREKRKTVNGDDLLWAMTTLGFEEYVEPLKIYLQKYREMEGEKSSVGRQCCWEFGPPNSPPLGSTLCRNNKKNREIITTQEIYVETPKQEKNHQTQRRKFTM